MIENVIDVLSIIGILFMGYFIGKFIEKIMKFWLIGSWNLPNEKIKNV